MNLCFTYLTLFTRFTSHSKIYHLHPFFKTSFCCFSWSKLREAFQTFDKIHFLLLAPCQRAECALLLAALKLPFDSVVRKCWRHNIWLVWLKSRNLVNRALQPTNCWTKCMLVEGFYGVGSVTEWLVLFGPLKFHDTSFTLVSNKHIQCSRMRKQSSHVQLNHRVLRHASWIQSKRLPRS